jgi:hypothetical protein
MYQMMDNVQHTYGVMNKTSLQMFRELAVGLQCENSCNWDSNIYNLSTLKKL